MDPGPCICDDNLLPGDILVSRSTTPNRISTFVVIQQVMITDDLKHYRLIGVQSTQTRPDVILWSNKGGHMYWNPFCPLNGVK